MATVFVTGANRGLGLEFVRQYAADGWQVKAAARNPQSSQELKKLLKEHRSIALHKLDVTSGESVQELADELGDKPIDVLIHNAGMYPRDGQSVGKMDYEGWREAMDTNLFGVFRLTEALLENVLASERKQIAAISSSMASLGMMQRVSALASAGGTAYQYRSSKTALNMAMLALSKELAPKHVSVVLLDPGWVKTDMGGPNAQLTPEESISGMRKVLAGNPKEISGKFLGYDSRERPW